MKYTLRWKKYTLHFKQAAGTSRGILHSKDTYFLYLNKTDNPRCIGLGECNLFKGLSYDDRPDYEVLLETIAENPDAYIEQIDEKLKHWPSIRFGLEMALIDLEKGGKRELFSSAFIEGKNGIPINGLIWMGDKNFMKAQIRNKLEQGYRCLKLKIGAIDFEQEVQLLKNIRAEFSAAELELRVDANGAFSPETALQKLKRLAKLNIHSIEQPIRQGQFEAMAELCAKTPLAIALDEELIGVVDKSEKEKLLSDIKPQYIILKPALIGGFKASEEWIRLANEQNIPWWITSALESNVGLNALAQWTYTLQSKMYQGLGTGQLYTNNVKSPLSIQNAALWHGDSQEWDLSSLKQLFDA